MGFFSRRPAAGQHQTVSSTLPDDEWLAASQQAYERAVGRYYGSPETMGRGGKERYANSDFGTALFFYGKSIDMLHTAYGFAAMEHRHPGPADAWLVDGFCSSLGAALSTHPNAPVDETVRAVTHRLRSIRTTCDRAGMSSKLYRDALDTIERYAPHVRVDDIFWT